MKLFTILLAGLFCQVASADLTFPETSNWMALVKDGYSASACAESVDSLPAYEVLATHQSIGVLVVKAKTNAADRLDKVACVDAVSPVRDDIGPL